MNSQTFLLQLEAALPKGSVVSDPPQLHVYAHDYSNTPQKLPLCCVIPTCIEDIQTLFELANHVKYPIIPRGAGTGKSGGAVPVLDNTVILDMRAFSNSIEIDIQNRVAIVESGVILSTFQTEVEKVGLFYPPDPASLKECTLGGTVAENAGGPRALKYGVTGNYVMGIEGVFANGTPFKLGGKCVKDVAGYDIKRLLIGSEGTLAVFTKIWLRLIPLPQKKAYIWASFKTIDAAVQALNSIIGQAITPSLAEFIEGACMTALGKQYPEMSINPDEKGHLLIGVDHATEKGCAEEVLVIIQALKENGVTRYKEAESDAEAQQWITQRQAISSALTAQFAQKISHDITVPVAEVVPYMRFIEDLNQKGPCKVLGYGHLGDGNIHVNILSQNPDVKAWKEDSEALEILLFKEALKRGGTLSGEHGIGRSKQAYMDWMFTPEERALFKSIKQVFDPNNILNPNKAI